MGEHTDYNLGLVLPVALELSTWVAGSRRDDLVELRSLDAPGEAVVDLSTGVGPTDGWGRYATAVVRALRDESIPFRGLSGVVASDVPLGAGLASSAALEVAIASALAEEPLDPLQLARVCRRAENEYVGVACGLMDQLTSTAATDGHALLLDCRDETYRQVPLPVDLAVVVVDSGTKRSLGDGAFNERVERGKAAAAALGLGSLRELGVGDLEGFASDLPEELAGCARHVVTENERVRRTVAAFEDGSLLVARYLPWLAREPEV